MKVTPKKVAGAALLAAPFVGIAIFSVLTLGWLTTFVTFGFVGVVMLTTKLGVKLLMD